MMRMMRWSAVMALQLAGCAAYAQVSPTAYRVLGQADLRRNGVNGVQGVELNNPLGIALDRLSSWRSAVRSIRSRSVSAPRV
jgi:hypothetical protein